MKYLTYLISLIIIITLDACNNGEETDNNNNNQVEEVKPDSLHYYQPFKNNSVFYNKISQNPEIDPNSQTMVQSLVESSNQAFLVVVKEWTVPVYFTSDSTPKQDVIMTEDWVPSALLKNVPIPSYAQPDPEEDGHMAIVDETSGCIYDFWEMKYTNDGWKAGWGNAIPMDGNGIFEKGFSARGSGFE